MLPNKTELNYQTPASDIMQLVINSEQLKSNQSGLASNIIINDNLIMNATDWTKHI